MGQNESFCSDPCKRLFHGGETVVVDSSVRRRNPSKSEQKDNEDRCRRCINYYYYFILFYFIYLYFFFSFKFSIIRILRSCACDKNVEGDLPCREKPGREGRDAKLFCLNVRRG